MAKGSGEVSRRIEDRASWLAAWMVYWANHKPQNEGQKPKVGGHQASSASCSTILAALYLHLKRPCDRVAVKPHAAPLLYALMYLLGRVSRDQIMRLREAGGLQPYPSQHDNPEFVDYSTSIEGLGPAAVVADAYEAFVQRDQLQMTTWPTYHAVVGDGELTELQIGGALYEAGRRRLGNVRWWIDLNRQSLDRPMEDGPGSSLAHWVRGLFDAHGWHVIDVRWGARLRAAFARPGGAALRTRLETLSDSHLQALLFTEPDVCRRALLGRVDDERPEVRGFLTEFARTSGTPPDGLADAVADLDDTQVAALVQDLGGHDLDALLDAAAQADAVTDRPTAIVCHTVKGWRMPGWSGHPENHGAIMTAAQMDIYRVRLLGAGAVTADPWAGFAEDSDERRVLAARAEALFPATEEAAVSWPTALLPTADETHIPLIGERSTAAAFGMLNAAYTRLPIGRRMAFLAPDVGLTTHLGGVIAATGVYDPHPTPDLGKLLRDQHHAMFGWRLTREGRFHSLPINEGLAAMALYAFGRPKRAVEGKQAMIPVGTIYDAFWKHAYTQVYFALYDGARFLAVGTPSGTSLSRESGTHQSIQAPAIFAGLPGLLAYEPAYAFDVKVLYDWAIRQMMQPDGVAVYLRLSTQELVQPFGAPAAALLEHHGLRSVPVFDEHPDTLARLERDIVAGGYWLLDRRGEPGWEPRRAATILATGPVMEDALRASEQLHADGVYVGVLNVTSWARLERDWARCEQAVALGDEAASHHLADLLADDEVGAPMVVVGDFSPQLAAWVGTALGRYVPVLGPRGFSQAGDLASIRRLHGIDAAAIVAALRAQARARA